MVKILDTLVQQIVGSQPQRSESARGGEGIRKDLSTAGAQVVVAQVDTGKGREGRERWSKRSR